MDLKVHINDVHGSQMAAKINGRFILDGHEFRFTAIAFGRIGGQNVGGKDLHDHRKKTPGTGV